jgi:AraC-like DNA-binding protein
MDFIFRYFNDNPENGQIGAGFLKFDTSSQFFNNCPEPYYRCSIVLEGSGTLLDNTGVLYSLLPGCVYQLTPGQTYNINIFSEIPWREYRICLSANAYKSLEALQLMNKATVFAIDLKAYLIQWMPVLVEELKRTPQKELLEVFFNMQKILFHIHNESIEHATTDSAIVIESAKQILSNFYTDDLSLSDVASNFHMSYEKFRKLFKEATGQSPLQYQLGFRFLQAQRFLTEGLSVKETAAKIGYADPYIFSKQFKKYVGHSPNYYKPQK